MRLGLGWVGFKGWVLDVLQGFGVDRVDRCVGRSGLDWAGREMRIGFYLDWVGFLGLGFSYIPNIKLNLQ